MPYPNISPSTMFKLAATSPQGGSVDILPDQAGMPARVSARQEATICSACWPMVQMLGQDLPFTKAFLCAGIHFQVSPATLQPGRMERSGHLAMHPSERQRTGHALFTAPLLRVG